jgi:preprotein translocase subunit SecG
MAELAPYFFGLVLTVLAVFLVLLVLVQRGRGGGLTGALGGVGGSSAFGAKAGDVFTKITVGAASIWIAVCVAAAYWAGHRDDALGNAGPMITPPPGAATTDNSAEPADGADTDDTGAAASNAADETSEAGQGSATPPETNTSAPAESAGADASENGE